ncbi:hypothetical protein [Actinokineospora enzanensis]|uniref:hypothetical protein n=1 Tax=Actinokineospora enzanensis TaxID=155975 RepID=UPI000374C20F|nr:hypothetical protein [Actinokineospora enzanensis]
MYVDETGADVSDNAADDTTHDEMTVEVDGQEYEVQENYDFDHDGHNDTTVVQSGDGYMAFTDTDGDGTADTVVELDHDGNVVAAGEYNESTGEWTEADPNSVENPSGDGTDNGAGHSSSHDTGDDSGTHTGTHSGDDSGEHTTQTSHSTGGEDITVDTKDGDVTAGAAEYDADGDGTNDTAVVTDQQGNTYAFTDVDGDGQADEAVVIESDGDVTVAQHTGDEEWTTVETGHLSADGTYESDHTGAATTSGSDAAWQG